MSWWPRHGEDEIEAVAAVLRSGKTNYWSGEHGQAFEREFAAYTDAKFALTCSNGTTALEMALRSMYLTGEEVIVPCRTFVATASAVANSGGMPVLADIDPKTLNVTVDTLSARLTPKTVAVIVVHYAGLPCDMLPILAWAKKNKLVVIEDCAHAHGARIDGQHVGTFGDIGCFSFCVGKIISTGGEGGMVITNRRSIHQRMAAYRDHGRYQMVGSKDMTQFQWTVEEFGTNLRMTEMQSAIGRIQLTKLNQWVARRREIALRYDKALGWDVCQVGHSHYMYIGRVGDRDAVLEKLNDAGVPARLGGCPNIGHERAFCGGAEACPVADAVGERTLALPIYPTMTNEEVEGICNQVNACLKT